jgi:Putative ER transporter, 6TM, N-terminal
MVLLGYQIRGHGARISRSNSNACSSAQRRLYRSRGMYQTLTYIWPAAHYTQSSVILGIWICLGSMFFLYIKAKKGPGPYTFASIFACICIGEIESFQGWHCLIRIIDISMTTAVFFPFPYYDIGKAIIIPLALHSCIALMCSVFIFPHTIAATFTTRLQGALSPLISGLSVQRSLFAPDQYTFGTPEFTDAINSTRAATEKSEAGLVAVAAAGRLLENDLIYSRFSPEDFRAFQQLARRMSARAHGLTTYFALIDPSRETFPTHSVPNTPAPGTPRVGSRHHSPERGSRRGRSTERDSEKEHERGRSSRTASPTLSRIPTPSSPLASPTQETFGGHSRGPTSATLQTSVSFSPLHQIQTGNTMFSTLAKTHSHGHSHSHQHSPSHSHFHSLSHRHGQFSQLLQASLTNLALKSKRRKREHAVGVFESQQYLNLEAKRLRDPRSEEYTNLMLSLLGGW